MDENILSEFNDLRLRWYSVAVSLNDGVKLSALKKELRSLLKDTKLSIKKARYVYDC